MAFDTIGVGAAPNDGNGDTLRAAMQKINANFALISSLANGEGASLVGVEDAAGRWTPTNLEAILAELGDFKHASAGFAILAKSTTGAGDFAEIFASSNEVLRRSGSGNLVFGTLVTANVGDDQITYPKIQNVSATDRLLGRSTAGAGDIEEIVCTAAGRALLDDVDAAAQLTTLGAQPADGDLTAIAALTTTAAGRSVLTIADPNLDAFLFWDDSAGTLKTSTLADIATEASPAAGDFIPLIGAEGDLRKVNWNLLPGAGGGISNVVEDTTPQLGGNLDLNGFDVTGSNTVHDLGTITTGTVTPAFSNPRMQKYVNDGAHTLAAPASGNGLIVLQITNGASAGAVTLSGFTRVDGDLLTTGNGDDFLLYISKSGTFISLVIVNMGLSLSDPNADRILFWDDSAGKQDWLAPGNSIAITGTTLDAIQDIRTSASPQFAGINLGHASDTTLTRTGAGDFAVEGNAVYRAGGPDVPLADGGTGASLADPNADRIMFWDDSAGQVTWLQPGNSVSISGTTLDTVQDLRTTANPQFATLELGHASDTTVARSAAGRMTIEGAEVQLAGKTMIPILAQALVPNTTSGAATATVETTTNDVMLSVLDFDAATDESAQITLPMPKSWNESTITARFRWTSAAASGNVVWGIQAVALSDDDATDAAFGTAQTVTDGVTAANDLMISAETSAVTIGGTPAEGDLVVFKVYRDADNGSDTMSGDARLIAVDLFITTNAANDA